MSNLLKEKHALIKLREKLEGRRGRLYRSCKGFEHLACNCKNEKEEGKGTVTSQNKFEILRSRVMQCKVKERTIRRQKVTVVECFKCGEKGHKCRECPLWKKKEREKGRVACVTRSQKVHQQRELAYSTKKKVQKGERKLRRAEEEEIAYMAKP